MRDCMICSSGGPCRIFQEVSKPTKNIVPFENSFPKNTKLYKLMITKPGESLDK